MADGRIIIDTEIDSSGIKKGMDEATRSAKSQAAKLAAEYRKQGMSASESFKKAWSEIERDSAQKGEETAKNWENSTNRINDIAKKGLRVITGIAAGAATVLGGMSAYAIKVGADFEEGMSKVQAISGATGNELESLTEKAKEMGAKTKFSATESAEAFHYMAMAGWKTGDMLNGIEGIMNLAAASGEDLASVSDIVTDALTAFGLQAKDSAHFADVLARASSDSNTNVGLMGYTFKYVAPIAGALKYSIEDTAVAIGLMANAGIKGEQAGTALRATLTRLVKPPKEAATALNALGISAVNADGSMKPLNELLTNLRTSFGKLNDSQKASYASSIAGTEAMSGLLAIINASDSDFNNLTESINNANGSAGEMAAIMQDNLKGKVEQLGGALETLGLTAYEKFQEPMKEAVESVTGTLEKLGDSMNGGELEASITKLADSFGDLIMKLANFLADHLPAIINGLTWIMDNASFIASGIAGIGTAILTLNAASMIGKVAGKFKLLYLEIATGTPIMKAFNIVLGLNPFILIATAIVGLVAALVVLWNTNEDFRNAVIGAWEKIKEVAGKVWGYIAEFFTKTIPDAFRSVKTFFTEDVPNWFKEQCDKTKQFFIDGWNSIAAFFTETIPAWIDSVLEWFGELPEKLGYIVGYCFAAILQFGYDILNWIEVDLPLIIEGIVNWFKELPGRIGEWLEKTWDDIYNWGSDVYNTSTQWISDTVDSIVDWFKELPGRIRSWLGQIILDISIWGRDMYNKAVQATKDTVDSVVDWFKELPDKIYNVGVDMIKGLWNGILSAKDWLGNKIDEFCSGVLGGFLGFFDIHSPSRLFRDLIGTNLVKGIGVGVDVETPNLEKDINANMADLTSKLKATVDYETARTTASVVAQNNINIGNTNNSTRNYNPSFNILAKVSVPLDGEVIAESTTPMVIENISDGQNSYSIARGGN